ncbi:hypothetical protein FACS1894199_18580 [Bacteroidia bacterium]|nr:hypothetical protein FACS1894199_18580 [Bacteroidia bacterium]
MKEVKLICLSILMLGIMFSVHGQTYDASKDIHYYMMDKKDKRELPAVSERTY